MNNRYVIGKTSYYHGRLSQVHIACTGKSTRDCWCYWTNLSNKRHRNNDVMSVRSGRGVGVKQPYCNCMDLIEEF